MNRDAILKRFGKNVKIERIKRDLTQEKLSEMMNVSQNYIANIERGKANMSIVKLFELAKFLSVEPSILIKFDE